VQSLLTIFEGSLGDKRKDSDLARNFIEDQLKVYAERLTAAEDAVTAFKRKNLGLMPGQGENFYTRLTDMRTALNQARLELAEAEQGRDALRRRFTEEAPPSLIDEKAMYEPAGPEMASPELDLRIQALQQKLDTLRVTYTEQHPDIVAIVPALEQLKEQRQREREQRQRDARTRKLSSTGGKTQDLVTQQLTISMAEYDATIAGLKERVREYERRLGELSSAANAIPQVEAQYTQLTRDYEVTKKNYDQLAARRESAQLTGDVQSNASTMEFRVIDPPQVSTQPDWPNRPLLRSLVLLAAIAMGIAFAFLMSRLRPTVDHERGLRELSGLAVFGTVTLAPNDEQRRQKKKGLVALGFCVLALLGVYTVMMALPLTQRIDRVEALFNR
jgi:polysaccharide chain length determinant protein (PEP-CTERM system associated)